MPKAIAFVLLQNLGCHELYGRPKSMQRLGDGVPRQFLKWFAVRVPTWGLRRCPHLLPEPLNLFDGNIERPVCSIERFNFTPAKEGRDQVQRVTPNISGIVVARREVLKPILWWPLVKFVGKRLSS